MLRFAGLIGVLVTFSTPSLAQACKTIEGTWKGAMVRDAGGSQPVSMTITADCAANWDMPNYCSLSEVAASRAKYNCSRGSIGTVTISRGSLVWRNTETGPRHGFYTLTVRR